MLYLPTFIKWKSAKKWRQNSPQENQNLTSSSTMQVCSVSTFPISLATLTIRQGSNWGEKYDTFPESAWVRVLTLNLTRVFTITQLLTPLLEAAAGPDSLSPSRIINIGSVDGLRVPSLETFSYSASKAGLHHLSRVLANHLGKRNITSNTIACGPFESKMMAQTLKQFKDSIVAGIPLGRIGTPEDVAGTCIFLSSRAGAYVNGATIALDGGSLVGSKL